MELVNLSPLSAKHLLLPDANGKETLLLVVKATYDVRGGTPRLAGEQEPVCLADEYHGEPGVSSLKRAAETALEKPGVDVILVGSAYAGPRALPEVDVRLSLGSLEKSVRVFGERRWQKRLGIARVGAAQPFERMPLRWEHAFGGLDDSNKDAPEGDARNPVGTGFRAKKTRRAVDGEALPNIEDPAHLVRGVADRPQPAGFSYVCPHWQPRAARAGTYDQTWQKKRAPLLPADFDPLFFQCAPPDQIIPGSIARGALVELDNASPGGRLAFELPDVEIEAAVKAGERRELALRLDTVIIDGDRERLELVWRAATPVHGRVYDVEWIRVKLRSDGNGGRTR